MPLVVKQNPFRFYRVALVFGFRHLEIPIKILIDHSYLHLTISFKVLLFPVGVIAFSLNFLNLVKKIFIIKGNIWTCNLLCKRPWRYHTARKTQLTEWIFKFIPIHASEFIEFRKNSIAVSSRVMNLTTTTFEKKLIVSTGARYLQWFIFSNIGG